MASFKDRLPEGWVANPPRPLAEVLVQIHGDMAMRRFVSMVESFRPAFSEQWIQNGIEDIIRAHEQQQGEAK